MSDEESKISPWGCISMEVSIGVWWFVWGVKGFWWGVLYGLGWEIWIGYRLAAFLLGK